MNIGRSAASEPLNLYSLDCGPAPARRRFCFSPMFRQIRKVRGRNRVTGNRSAHSQPLAPSRHPPRIAIASDLPRRTASRCRTLHPLWKLRTPHQREKPRRGQRGSSSALVMAISGGSRATRRLPPASSCSSLNLSNQLWSSLSSYPCCSCWALCCCPCSCSGSRSALAWLRYPSTSRSLKTSRWMRAMLSSRSALPQLPNFRSASRLLSAQFRSYACRRYPPDCGESGESSPRRGRTEAAASRSLPVA
jgi:hypothetical protein